MESLQGYGESMDTSEDFDANNLTAQNETTSHVVSDPFRRKSLLFATYPWFTAIFATKSTLAEAFGNLQKDHYAYHLAESLDKYDSSLEAQNNHNAPMKALLRDANADFMTGMSAAAISKREISMLKSRGRANELCSLLCAHRLVDVIFLMEPDENLVSPPKHKKMGINILKIEKALRPLENWTAILHKFRHNFSNSKAHSAMNITISDLPTHQLHALFQLHSNMNVNKTLINLQLAATHISFMMQRQIKEDTIPDFPGTLQEFKDLVLSSPSFSNIDGFDYFVAFLERLAGENEQIDNLRLPLQVALLISPIFLLQDVQMHLSSFYVQRYKIVLYSKSLGNIRPKIVAEIEKIIWVELFDIAKGLQTVYDAASNIVKRTPEFYDHLDAEIRGWFMLAPIGKKEDYLNLTSFSIQAGTIPDGWPSIDILKSGSTLSQSHLISGGHNQHGENLNSNHVADQSEDVSKRGTQKKATTYSGFSTKGSKRRSRRSKSTLRRLSEYSHRATGPATQNIPLVVGRRFLKVENIDLEELSMVKQKKITEHAPLFKNALNLFQLSTRFYTFNVHGERLEHTFSTPFEKVIASVEKFWEKIEGNFAFGDRMEFNQSTAIKAINREVTEDMSPRYFQQELRSKHIIITDCNLPRISCDRRGLMSLNSLKEVVSVEDQSTSDAPQLKEGILKQFVDNLELNDPNTSRIVRMKSYSGVESSLFSSNHAAWRDTISDPYCDYDSSEESSLCWTDISTVNAVQFWRIAPAGFGVYLDIRSGCQLVIVATSESGSEDGVKDYFTNWGRYLQESDQLDPALFCDNKFEAIRLEPGNRLILRPNTPYALITLEHTVVTGGLYLSTHTLYETLIGRIHSFVLPSFLTEGKEPSFSTFLRRIVHYMHNAYVLNDSSDRSHLLTFSTLDDARDLFSLVTIAIFLNVLDDRTYELSSDTYQEDNTVLQQCQEVFDLNAIPVIERYHLCYTRGLSFDLLNWFFENYSFSSDNLEEDDMDAFTSIFIPFLVHIGRQIIKYKCIADESGRTASSTSQEVNYQVRYALFGIELARETWLEEMAVEEEKNYLQDLDDDDNQGLRLDVCDLDFDFSDYSIRRREILMDRSTIDDFLEAGKTNADLRFFRGLTSQFDFENLDMTENADLSN